LIDEAYKDSISRSGYSDISSYVYFFLKALGESYSSAIMALRKKRVIDAKEDELGRILSLASSYSLYGLSIRDLSKMLSLSSRSIIRHLSLYKEKGLLRIVKIQKALYYSLL
jgi:DNA-binding transcriptional ArsR family regulator